MVDGVEGDWLVGTTSARGAVTQSSTPQENNRYLLLRDPIRITQGISMLHDKASVHTSPLTWEPMCY